MESAAINPYQLGLFILCFVTAGGLYMKIRSWEMKMKGVGEKREVGPQPFIVKEATEHASKHELEVLEKRIGGEIHQLHGRISGLRSELGDEIAAIDSALDDQTKAINERIDAIPQRTISLLNETKQLHASRG